MNNLSPIPVPLAEELRHKPLGEVIGQQHLLGEDMLLCIAFESGQQQSCILWGLPAAGTTTLAHLIKKAVNYSINQKLREVVVQIFGFPHYLEGVKRA
jgi:putative ATPase